MAYIKKHTNIFAPVKRFNFLHYVKNAKKGQPPKKLHKVWKIQQKNYFFKP